MLNLPPTGETEEVQKDRGEEVETELYFLLHCDKYSDLRESFFPKNIIQYKEFGATKDEEKNLIFIG